MSAPAIPPMFDTPPPQHCVHPQWVPRVDLMDPGRRITPVCVVCGSRYTELQYTGVPR